MSMWRTTVHKRETLRDFTGNKGYINHGVGMKLLRDQLEEWAFPHYYKFQIQPMVN